LRAQSIEPETLHTAVIRMTGCATVLEALEDLGILLLQDQELPSIVGLFCGRRVNSSWWSIPESHDIFRCLQSLDPGTALVTRLLNRKVTYVHRRLWPALVTLGAAREPWQMRALSSDAKDLLAQLTRGESTLARGQTARDLQARLLVVAHEVHTPSGRHEVGLEMWGPWTARMQVRPLSTAEVARGVLETASRRIGAAEVALPWCRDRLL
jgi:hypothetical protein